MPRFFIHARCGGEIVRDVEGQDLPGLEAAQAAQLQLSENSWPTRSSTQRAFRWRP